MDQITPHFGEFFTHAATWALCGLAGLAVVALGHYLRLALNGMQARCRLEERLAERERMARELHDTLLQGIQGLILRFEALTDTIPVQEPSRIGLERALSRADELLAESRARIKALRTTSPAGLTLVEALAAEGAQLTPGPGVQFSVSAEGPARLLHTIVQEEALLIGREALLNALAHSNATRIEVDLHYGGNELRLRIRDNGRGISTAHIAGSRDHWGLVGMQERAKQLRARLNIWSAQDAGTEIDLRVPAAVAYRRASRAAAPPWRTHVNRATASEVD